MESSLVVAQTFLDLAREDRVRLSAGQLHKLVYFAHGLHLGAFNGKPLIDENVFAWSFGPLIPEVYNVVQRYANELGYELPLSGMDPIGKATDHFTSIKSTWDAYKNCTNLQLDLVVSAPGSPWDEVWHQDQEHFKVIPNSIIQSYYARVLRKRTPTQVGKHAVEDSIA